MRFLLLLIVFALSAVAHAKSVHGYVTKKGTYVAPYHRTAPNKSKLDNYSTKGNVNPYTGQAGHKNPYGEKPKAYGAPKNAVH